MTTSLNRLDACIYTKSEVHCETENVDKKKSNQTTALFITVLLGILL